MIEIKYKVTINSKTVAENMDLETAIILVKALFNEYYSDTDMVVSVYKMESFGELNIREVKE